MVVEQQGPIAFDGAENIALYASSEAMERGFCKVCGSSLFTKLTGADHYFVSAGTIAEDAKLNLVLEIFFDRKPAYYSFANKTRKMTAEGFAKAWAGETNG